VATEVHFKLPPMPASIVTPSPSLKACRAFQRLSLSFADALPGPLTELQAGWRRLENAMGKNELVLKLKDLVRQVLPQPTALIFVKFRGPEALSDIHGFVMYASSRS
jgi:hypothetical protein